MSSNCVFDQASRSMNIFNFYFFRFLAMCFDVRTTNTQWLAKFLLFRQANRHFYLMTRHFSLGQFFTLLRRRRLRKNKESSKHQNSEISPCRAWSVIGSLEPISSGDTVSLIHNHSRQDLYPVTNMFSFVMMHYCQGHQYFDVGCSAFKAFSGF